MKTHVQPEVFFIDPQRGLAGLQKVLHLADRPRVIEGVDVAHTAGTDTVAAIVQYIDGLPFKPGYRRMRIREVSGGDDFGAIHEAVWRRFQRRREEEEPMPDLLLIDGGKGQLGAATAALESLRGTVSIFSTRKSGQSLDVAQSHRLGETRGVGLPDGCREAAPV